MNNVNERLWLKLRRLLSPGEWSAQLLGLSKSLGTSCAPGLIMVQIDGFSLSQLHQAMLKNEMPFLASLLNKEHYQLHPYYSGLPCATPSVQGELFYGVRQCVPGFFFFDKQYNKVFRMYNGDDVEEIERRLQAKGRGLLQGGSSYANIFTGGASEAHFCAGSLGWSKVWREMNLANMIMLSILNLCAMLRIAFLFVWEIALSVMDLIYGLIKREDVATEFKFVPLRVTLSVVLRELVTLCVRIDIARGLPIIHLNFIGYDEQAHRRGPSSATAHWALKGIDAAIRRIYKAALHSTRRSYDVWVYSDHGQEKAEPYGAKFQKSVNEAVAETFIKFFSTRRETPPLKVIHDKANEQWGIQYHRLRYLGKPWDRLGLIKDHHLEDKAMGDLVIAAIGPLGNVHVFLEMSREEKHLLARELVHSAHIPLVLMADGKGRARGWNQQGEFVLPDQAPEVLGPAHPYLAEVTQDLIDLCHHENAGTFVISGWQLNGTTIAFPFEHGVHAGPGVEENNAFALLPKDTLITPLDRQYLKNMDLREAALHILGRREPKAAILKVRPLVQKKASGFFDQQIVRIMTYNVHSCVGLDGKVSAERIARVIARYEPDIVALQELDMNCARTNGIDQPHLIANYLEMMYHFHPSIKVEEEHYGNAVLSRFPVELVMADRLPGLPGKRLLPAEERGALWASIDVNGTKLQLINTHLGLDRRESLVQSRVLTGMEWLKHPVCRAPVVLCGDFNALPYSSTWRTVRRHLQDAQQQLDNHRPRATWFSYYPLGRIDHIFVSKDINVVGVKVFASRLEKIASDHLPLVVDVKIKNRQNRTKDTMQPEVSRATS